ncbi:hypothetical protein CAP35_13585 [Chitinophagaceae bacterium IBVUCB1]|nr:hypothetical protein CAP35_13585 [Chitinophagaceae bacterium IBVUCB1]
MGTAAGFRNLANRAMSFNGTNSVAVVPHSSLLSPSNISIVAVVKTTGFYSGTCQGNNIIYKSYAYYTPGCWAMHLTEDDGNCNTVSPTTVKLDYAGSSSGSYTLSSNTVDTGKWYFMVTTFNGSTIKRYMVQMIDTVYTSGITPISTTSFSAAIGTNTDDVRIGGTQNPPFRYWFNGAMDELVLFNKELADSNVQSIYDYLWGLININFTNRSLLRGDTLHVNYVPVNPTLYSAGNVFSIELSNAAGSFSSPTIIGSLTSTVAGKIICTIPTTIPTGSGYRIRIVSSNAASRMPDNGVNITVTNSISKISLLHNTTLLPNPNNGSFTLTGNTLSTQPIHTQVYNSIGQLMFTKDIAPANGAIKETITLPEVASGIYVLRLYVAEDVKTIRFRVDK